MYNCHVSFDVSWNKLLNKQSCWWFEPQIMIQIQACRLYHVAADWIKWSGYCNHSWCHQMETFFMLLALCAGNSPVTGEFPSQRPVTWSFDVFFDLRINGWVNNHEAGDWRHPHNHYDVTVMYENTNIHPCDVSTLCRCCLSNHRPKLTDNSWYWDSMLSSNASPVAMTTTCMHGPTCHSMTLVMAASNCIVFHS